jgi:glucosamine--fructose-6-phosphate aminotransferase (isomerizing)
MIALRLFEDRISLTEHRSQIIADLHALPGQIRSVLDGGKALKEMAEGVLANSTSFLLIDRGYQCVYVSEEMRRLA